MISEKADEIRYRIDLQQAELIKQLNGIAGSEQLIEIVQSDDPLAKSMEEERLRSVIADAIEVRLFGPGEAEVDRNASPPFTYTSLDLVNRAEAGLEVYPEAVNPGDHWILSIATPLSPPGDDGVYGTLFVYLDMNALSDGLTDELEGELRLSQTFANAPSYEILSAGHGATPNAAPVVRDLINPNWQVEFFPASRITSATAGDPLHFTMPLVIFFVLALAGTFAGLLRIRRAIDSDATRLSHQITDAINKDFNPSTD
ncbi:MAG: hypothetical protein GWN87_28780, partial [Desulfuromonadales bacterium]|nr:hypothetical protein [Desulfuromonadales bacterium]NIS39927.1 hypothetical protein [Desulfuromonadales bacterium]